MNPLAYCIGTIVRAIPFYACQMFGTDDNPMFDILRYALFGDLSQAGACFEALSVETHRILVRDFFEVYFFFHDYRLFNQICYSSASHFSIFLVLLEKFTPIRSNFRESVSNERA